MLKMLRDISRREFMKYGVLSAGSLMLSSMILAGEGDKNRQKIHPLIEIVNPTYTVKILVSNTYPVADLAIDPTDNHIYCVQHIEKLYWGVYELVDGEMKERFAGGLTNYENYRQQRIEINSVNEIFIYEETNQSVSIRVYDLKTNKLKLKIENPNSSENLAKDMAVNPRNERLFLIPESGGTRYLDVETKSMTESKVKGISRIYVDSDGNQYVLLHALYQPDYTIVTYTPHLRKEIVKVRPAEAAGGTTLDHYRVRFNPASKNLIWLGTVHRYDEKVGETYADYILAIDPKSGKVSPILKTQSNANFSILGLDVDRKGNIYFSYPGQPKGEKNGGIIKLTRK